MRRNLLKVVGVLMLAFALTGCGVNIRQEDNKIFTDASKDQAYSFTESALKTKGYKVKEASKINFYIHATPEYNQTFQIENATTEVQATVGENPANTNETMVTVVALANGQIDEELSKDVARQAVREIIAELNKYGKHIADASDSHIYPVATAEQVKAYVRAYFSQNNTLEIIDEDAETGTITIVAKQSNSPYNEPLMANVTIDSDETNRVIVSSEAMIQGNYDANTNQGQVTGFVTLFNAYLAQYPVVERGVRSAYRYIDFDKAFQNTLAALNEAGFNVIDSNSRSYLITATKDNLNITTTFTEINTNIAVNIEAFKESPDVTITRESLALAVATETDKLVEIMAAYQTIVPADRIFIGKNESQLMRAVEQSLTNLGYTSQVNANAKTVYATRTADNNQAHFITLNNLGSQGLSLDIQTMYNTKGANANTIAQRESGRLLAALDKYLDLK